MERYWHHLGEKPSIARVSADGYRAAVMAIGVNDKEKRDYHGTKLHIYKAITGFMRLLIRDGYKADGDLQAVRKLKPGRKFTSQTTEYPNVATVKATIEGNLTRTRGRKPFDIHLMNTLLHLYAYTGIRRMEAAALEVKDIDLETGSLLVWGKGNKRRRIPIAHTLEPVLRAWLLEWRPQSDVPWLLLQQDGTQLTENAIDGRFKRLSERGIKIKPHGLRHASATILANDGMPVPLISLMLGHRDIRITNLYLNPTESDLFEYMRGRPAVEVEVEVDAQPVTRRDKLDDFVPMF
jgi:integrase/recombinase XerD